MNDKNQNDDNKRWEDAFKEELKVVKKRHSGDHLEKNLTGLAFSGGGIRSATFGLGVLEGLKNLGWLQQIDYLSTVSGGGYIGAWLSANCKRAAEATAPTDDLKAPCTDWLDPRADWEDSIGHLRRYSNYLSPQVGFLSADTWSMGTIWLRNAILVQLVVILAIAIVLLVPRPLFALFQRWPDVGDLRWTTIFLFISGVVGIAGNQLRLNHNNLPLLQFRHWAGGLVAAALSGAAAWFLAIWLDFHPFAHGRIYYHAAAPIALLLVMAGFWLQPAVVRFVNYFFRRGQKEQVNYTQAWVQVGVVLPMMGVGLLVAAILWGQSKGDLSELDSFGDLFKAAWHYWPFPLSIVFISLWLLSLCSIRNLRGQGSFWALVAPIPATLVLHSLLCAIMLLFREWGDMGDEGDWLAFVWGPSLVLYAFSLTILVLIGIVGRQSTEGVREWWSRFGAWLAIYGFAWIVVSVTASYGPYWSAALWHAHPWTSLSIGGGWIGTTIAGLMAGNSDSTGEKYKKNTSSKVLDVVATVAPFVFIAGLLVAVATVLHFVITLNSDLPGDAMLPGNTWALLSHANVGVRREILAGCFVCMLLLAWRVDINEFGLNAFYRSRLVRCYLGATRFRLNERNPQNFTGFDDADDIKLAELSEFPAGPLHIVNCALNLGGSSDLALHTRHSATFTLTPLHCGSNYISHNLLGNKTIEMGYSPTGTFGGEDGQPTLGQAISVSGAAASPNMGYHTSPVVAFLLTLFNVRLGWWFPNPRKSGVNSSSPWFSLRYLIMELFGGADDTSKFLAISDGGHFENMAAYELIKRKCRTIIISDAECDPELRFEGLGTLIRMCAVDFHAKITIDVGPIRVSGKSHWSHDRYAIGTIEYDDSSTGLLIYLKASMTGNEDTDIFQYKAMHATFPHESTSNQFYREDQFESYRGLGRDIAEDAFRSWQQERNNRQILIPEGISDTDS